MDYDKLNYPDARALFIAEAGINHDGDVSKAKKMIDVAADAGADYVKFQTFVAEKLVTPNALTSSYIDKGSHKGETFRDLLKRLELKKEAHYVLKEYCDRRGIQFLSTAFDEDSFAFLLKLGIDAVKVASGDLTNIPLLKIMAEAKLPMIVSTGMGTLQEIEEAVHTITMAGNKRIVLMHCISWYPAEIETANLRYMETLRKTFGFPVGYSDHTLGITMGIAARALGAVIIEKHFTLDAKQFGPDHAASIEPDELSVLIRAIRDVEAGLGTPERSFGEKELGQRKVHRRSVVTSRKVKAGEVFTSENLAIKRPGIGIEPKHFYEVIGKKAKVDIDADKLLRWADIAE